MLVKHLCEHTAALALLTCTECASGCGASWHPYTAGDTDCLNTNLVYYHST